MNPSFDSWTILFLLAASQGIFLSFVLIARNSKVSNLLAAVILSFSLMLAYYVAFWTHYLQYLPRIVNIAGGFTFIFSPLLLFYLKSKKGHLYFNYYHFLPFTIYLVYFLTSPLLNHSMRIVAGNSIAIFQNIHLAFYTYLILMAARVDLAKSKIRHWKMNIAYAYAGYTISFLLYYILVWSNTLKIEYDYMISLASSFFIYFVGYYSYKNPDVIKSVEGGKYEKNQLSLVASQSILNSIKKYMEEHKPYTNSELKLSDLANNLSLSTNQISQVINELTGQNFSDFINNYRIEEAKAIIEGELEGNLKLIDVAFDSGFNNKTSFNNAFKKFMNCSPSEFYQLHKNKFTA